jgi:hypothetical protein
MSNLQQMMVVYDYHRYLDVHLVREMVMQVYHQVITMMPQRLLQLPMVVMMMVATWMQSSILGSKAAASEPFL